ncbi:hypothetical protein MUK42_29936 [Musa troglodytarum]|uniref:Uncharacterized protein n=1 Tax=Musa troglodytarum TaxID=320322 RepID=A0A9E7GBA0_9LILI|nr:hypothetical protein MUK42_29936 [Musa troglodytarum]
MDYSSWATPHVTGRIRLRATSGGGLDGLVGNRRLHQTITGGKQPTLLPIQTGTISQRTTKFLGVLPGNRHKEEEDHGPVASALGIVSSLSLSLSRVITRPTSPRQVDRGLTGVFDGLTLKKNTQGFIVWSSCEPPVAGEEPSVPDRESPQHHAATVES